MCRRPFTAIVAELCDRGALADVLADRSFPRRLPLDRAQLAAAVAAAAAGPSAPVRLYRHDYQVGAEVLNVNLLLRWKGEVLDAIIFIYYSLLLLLIFFVKAEPTDDLYDLYRHDYQVGKGRCYAPRATPELRTVSGRPRFVPWDVVQKRPEGQGSQYGMRARCRNMLLAVELSLMLFFTCPSAPVPPLPQGVYLTLLELAMALRHLHGKRGVQKHIPPPTARVGESSALQLAPPAPRRRCAATTLTLYYRNPMAAHARRYGSAQPPNA